MKTYLKTENGEIWQAHIFHIKIHQQEGLKALCDIEIQNNLSDIPQQLSIWIDNTFQFTGTVTGILRHYTPHTQKIELTQNHTPSITPFSQQSLYFSTPIEHLPYVYHYHRQTGALTLTHLVKTTHKLNVPFSQVIDYQSSQHPIPIGIDLEVHARWRWQKTTIFDIWPMILKHCGGQLATLTPQAFIKNWHQAMSVNLQSGYRVLYNKLESVRPQNMPLSSQKNIQQAHIDGQCIIEARQEQKYHEIGHIQLGEAFQKRKKMVLHVPIDDHDDQGFFTTDMGQQWLDQAYAAAYNHFLAINRQKRIDIQLFLTPDDMTQLSLDTTFESSMLTGKIMRYTIENKGNGYICAITIANCCDGIVCDVPSHPCYPMWQKCLPQTTCTGFIEDFCVHHTAQEQLSYLESQPSGDGPTRVPVTAIYLLLKDLRPGPVITKKFGDEQ